MGPNLTDQLLIGLIGALALKGLTSLGKVGLDLKDLRKITDGNMTQKYSNQIEKLSGLWETLRLWVVQAWKIAFTMVRGSYFVQERQRLFSKLGEELYYKSKKGEFLDARLQGPIDEIDRLTKKLELSEMRIRSLRFGPLMKKIETEVTRD